MPENSRKHAGEVKPEDLNALAAGTLPGYLGLAVTQAGPDEVRMELDVQPYHLAPNGYLHAGCVVTLADTACGNATVLNLPQGAVGFTTVELKTNYLGTARKGVLECVAKPSHLGKTTQVWDATVYEKSSGKTLALFRCTQMVLYPQEVQ